MPKGLNHKNSNQSVRVKPKLRADNETAHSVKEKTLKVQILKKNKIRDGADSGNEKDYLDNIDLDEIVPSIPSELPYLGFPEDSNDDFANQTIDADNLKNKKSTLLYNLEATRRTKRDPHNEQIFSNLNNTAMIKNLDAGDEVPSKPILNKVTSSNELGRSDETKIDD